MEALKFKLQYFSSRARYLHSVKSADTPAIETLISASHVKMTPDPPSIALKGSCKVPTLCLFPKLKGKIYMAKMISKGGKPKLKNAILLENSSHRYGLIFREFMPP